LEASQQSLRNHVKIKDQSSKFWNGSNIKIAFMKKLRAD